MYEKVVFLELEWVSAPISCVQAFLHQVRTMAFTDHWLAIFGSRPLSF